MSDALTEYLTVSQAAAELSAALAEAVRPRDVSDLFYGRGVPDALGPVVGGRRLVRRDALPAIGRALRARRRNRRRRPTETENR